VSITDSLKCSAYLTTSRLPADCAKAGLTDVETCHRFLASLDLPELCRAAGITTSGECETMLRQRAVTKKCGNLLPTAKVDATTRSEICSEIIYRDTAAKVVCEGLTAAECTTTVKTELLGSVAEAADRLDGQRTLGEAANKRPVNLKEWRAGNPQPSQLFADTTVKDTAGLTALPSREAIIVTAAGTVQLAGSVVTVRDTDGDGVADDVELRHGLDPTKAVTNGQTPDADALRGMKDMSGIDQAMATGAVLGHPMAEGTTDDRLAVATVANAKSADGQPRSVGLVLRGRGVPGEVVSLYVYSDVPLVATTTVDANGEWQYTIEDPLNDGVHEAYVAINDDTGRVTRKSDPLAFVIQAAQAVAPGDLKEPAALAPDVNVASTSAPSQNLDLYIIGGIMLLLVAILMIVIIVLTRRRK
jgi:hypothetical protein